MVGAVIRNRDFRHLWLAQILSQVAINMMAFILALRVYQVTYSNTAVSLTILFLGLPAIIFGIPAGVMADYLEKKFILLFCNLLRGFLVLGFFLSSESLPWIYFLAFFASLLTQFFVPAEGPLIPQLVSGKLLLSANSLFSLSFYSSMAAGFLLSGPALRFLGAKNVFLLVAFLLFLAAFFISRLPGEEKPKVLPWVNFWGKIKKLFLAVYESLLLIRQNKEIFEALFLLTLAQIAIAIFSSLLPGFAHRVVRVALEDASLLILGPAFLGVLAGCLLLGFWRIKNLGGRLLSLVLIFSGFLVILLSFSPLLLSLFWLFLLGIAQSFIIIPANTLLQKRTQERFRGRIYGFLTSLVGGAAIFPAVLGGFLADNLGVGRTIAALGGLILVCGVYRLRKGRV